MCLEQEQQEHKPKNLKKKNGEKQTPLLESESAKLQKYNLKTKNEIQI